jgi:hypothetical protein
MSTPAPPAVGAAGRPRPEGWRLPTPLLDFLETHDLHIIPHRVPHRKRVRQTLAIAVIGLLVFSAWWWVIPRTEVTLVAQYHEGLFNAIAVDMKVVNSGTVALGAVHIELVVTDLGTNGSVGVMRLNTTIAPHRTLDLDAVRFKGDQLTTSYGIFVTLSYDAGNGRVTKTVDFRTEEPYMNLYFQQRIA